MANIMLRHQCSVSNLSKLLRQTQIRVVKFSSDSDEPEKGKKTLLSLLSSLQTNQKLPNTKDPRMARPKQASSKPKRDVTGKQINPNSEAINIIGMDNAELLDATKSVSKLGKTERLQQRTESDLLKKLKTIAVEATSARESSQVSGEKMSLSDMKVEKTGSRANLSTSRDRRDREDTPRNLNTQKNLTLEQIAFLESRSRMRRQRLGASEEEEHIPIDIFGAPGLGIFSEPLQTKPQDTRLLQTWKKCAERELRILSTPAPRNRLEEFIELTEQGKLWRFPIDNEQDMEYSHEPFHEHVFLEQHIEAWCPKSGPVRHFMEVVCHGLSKNPYASVEYKHKCIQWFRDYFERAEVNESLVHQGLWSSSPNPNPTQKIGY